MASVGAFRGTQVFWSLCGVALTFIFAAAIRFHDWPLFRWLNYRPIMLVGTLSYFLYLVHDIVLHAVARLWPDWNAYFKTAAALAASFLAAWAIFLLVERPCATLRRRLSGLG